jgi:hypothetical protein
MTLIVPNRRSCLPEVRVSVTGNGRQVRICLTTILVERAKLGDVKHIAIEHDDTERKLRFIVSGEEYHGIPSHRLSRGGSRAFSYRVMQVARSKLDFLVPGIYVPSFYDDGYFEISYEGLHPAT